MRTRKSSRENSPRRTPRPSTTCSPTRSIWEWRETTFGCCWAARMKLGTANRPRAPISLRPSMTPSPRPKLRIWSYSPSSARARLWANMGSGQPLDMEKHGSFAQVLLDGLAGKADKEGYEPDGIVTVDELAEYVDKELGGLIRKRAKTREERRMLPFVIGGRSSHFELTRNPAVTAKVEERLSKLAKLQEENKVSKERADEGRKLLERMPKLESQRSLRKKYQELADGKLSAEDFDKARADILDTTKLRRSASLAFAAK